MSRSFSDFFLGRDPEEAKNIRICPKCGAEVIGLDSSFCSRCGFDMSERASWICPSCNQELTSEFCPDCGKKRPDKKPDEPKKDEPKSKPVEEKKSAEKPEPKEKPKPSTWVCKNPACRARSELPAEFVACPYCGMRRPKPKPAEYTCPTCGKTVSSRYNFCPFCMTKIGGAN